MEKHFLLAIGDDQSAFQAGRFVENFFHYKHAVQLTLVYVGPQLPEIPLDSDEVFEKQRITGDWKRKQEQKAQELLNKGQNKACHRTR